MPVTAPHENMEVDGDDHNIEEASTSKAAASGSAASTSSNSVKPPANDATVSNVMASPSTIPSVTVSLHPLVIMNISEHWTRIRAQEGSPSQGKVVKLKLKFDSINAIYPLTQLSVHWLANKLVATLRLWIHLSSNFNTLKKTLLFGRIIITPKRNNVSKDWSILSSISQCHCDLWFFFVLLFRAQISKCSRISTFSDGIRLAIGPTNKTSKFTNKFAKSTNVQYSYNWVHSHAIST